MQLSQEAGGHSIEFTGIQNALLVEGVILTSEELAVLGLHGIDPEAISYSILYDRPESFRKFLFMNPELSPEAKERRVSSFGRMAMEVFGQSPKLIGTSLASLIDRLNADITAIFDPFDGQPKTVQGNTEKPLSEGLQRFREAVLSEIRTKGRADIATIESHMWAGQPMVVDQVNLLSADISPNSYKIINNEVTNPTEWIVDVITNNSGSVRLNIDYATMQIKFAPITNNGSSELATQGKDRIHQFQSISEMTEFLKLLQNPELFSQLGIQIEGYQFSSRLVDKAPTRFTLYATDSAESALDVLVLLTGASILIGATCNPGAGEQDEGNLEVRNPVYLNRIPLDTTYFASCVRVGGKDGKRVTEAALRGYMATNVGGVTIVLELDPAE